MHKEQAYIKEETFISRGDGNTLLFAQGMAKNAHSGQVICLKGDLGAGKTVFAKGFANGLGIDEPVTSPTFTLVKEYYGGRLPMYHFDTYRIEDPDELTQMGLDEYFHSDGVCLVEWPERIEELIPEDAVIVSIEKDYSQGDDFRIIRVTKRTET